MLEAQFRYEILLHENHDEDDDDGTQFSFKICWVTLGNSQSNTTVLVWIFLITTNEIRFNSMLVHLLCLAVITTQMNAQWQCNLRSECAEESYYGNHLINTQCVMCSAMQCNAQCNALCTVHCAPRVVHCSCEWINGMILFNPKYNWYAWLCLSNFRL